MQGLTAQQLTQLNNLESLRTPLVMPVALRPPAGSSPVSPTTTTISSNNNTVSTASIPTSVTSSPTTPPSTSTAGVVTSSSQVTTPDSQDSRNNSAVATANALATLQLKYQQNLAQQLSQFNQLGALNHLAGSTLVNCKCPATQITCTCGASSFNISALASQIEAQKTLASQIELQKTLAAQLELQKNINSHLDAQRKSSEIGSPSKGALESPLNPTLPTTLPSPLDFASGITGTHKALTAQLDIQKTLANQIEAQKSLAYQLEAQKLLASHLEASKNDLTRSIFQNWR